MHDPWMDRLSEYVDGELKADEQRAVEAHIAGCEACRAAIDDLRQVIAEAALLEDRLPAVDLWTGIAARIGDNVHAGAGTAAGATPRTDGPGMDGKVRPIGSTRAPTRWHFSATQLAAAAVLLMTLSGGSVWLLERDAGDAGDAGDRTAVGTIMHSAGALDGDARLVSSEPAMDPEYDRTVADLQEILDDNRAQLDPSTIEVVERSMLSIDHAIADAQEALRADPGNVHLHRQLDSTMRKKLDLLRRATRGAT